MHKSNDTNVIKLNGFIGIHLLLELFVRILISAAFLWIGMKAVSFHVGMPKGAQYCSYIDLLQVSAATALTAMLPYVGWLASWVVLFYMLKKVTEADTGEIIAIVLISRLAALLIIPHIISIL